MIVAFDLDDTLYRELDYVESGFAAVAHHLRDKYDISADDAYATMLRSLEEDGRGRQFDDVLNVYGLNTAGRRTELVGVYRRHIPHLTLPIASASAIGALRHDGHRLFLVTDGNHRVQARKVTALDLWDQFERCYLTYRYGRSSEKPSPRVFELMLARTLSTPADLVYVGDNPHKDFVGIRKLGGTTIRVHSGAYSDVVARSGFDADHHVESIDKVPAVVAQIFRGR